MNRLGIGTVQARYVDTFVKNAGLGFAIPYLHNGQMHDYDRISSFCSS